ncbi:MAG: hypothetical protein WBG13_01295, partial [Pseudolabrys sp.]
IKVTPGPVLVEDASGTENSKPRGEEKQATASDPGDPTAIDQKIPSADAFAGPAAELPHRQSRHPPIKTSRFR